MVEILHECAKFMIFAVAMKAIIGFHWPWETCDCCGKKYRDHKK